MNGARVSHQPDNPVPLFGSGPRRSLNPTAAGIVLGTELRRMRAERRLTATRAATLINASVSKVSRLERAESPPDPRDIEILADAYGVNPAERAQLRSLTRRAREPEWFDRYTDCAASWMQRLIALESDAVYYCAYEARLAPTCFRPRSTRGRSSATVSGSPRATGSNSVSC